MIVSVNLLPNAQQIFFDANGEPLANGTVGFYVPLTLTPKVTYSDQAGTIPNANPVLLDSAGRAVIYGLGSYREIVKDSLGNTIWDLVTAVPSAFLSASTVFIRANIPTTTITATIFVSGGYAVAGDLGTGAIYTSIGAGPTNTGAIQDFVGTWFKLVLDNGVINAGWFGVKGDGITNDGPNLQAALDAAQLAGVNVILPQLNFGTTQQIVVPNTVKLLGSGKRYTSITAITGFPPSTAVVRLGRVSEPLLFDCALWDMTVHCSLIAGSIGVYGTNLQEGSGAFRISVQDFKDSGIWYDTGSIHITNQDLEIYSTNSPANYGIKLTSVSASFKRVTTFGNGVGNCLAGFYLLNSYVELDDLNMEGSTDGILVDGSNVDGSVSYFSGTVTNLVHFNGGDSDLTLIAGNRSFSGFLVKDDLTGVSISNPVNVLRYWSRRASVLNTIPTTVTVSPYTITSRDTTVIANVVGSSLGLVLPLPNVFPGRTIYVSNDQSQLLLSISNNVTPLGGGAAQSSILPAITGAWAILQSNATTNNWLIVAQGVPIGTGGSIPTFVNATPYTVVPSDSALSINVAGTATITLPTPAANPGRTLWIRTVTANLVNSSVANIGKVDGTAGATILVATQGKWAFLQCDGVNWQVFGTGAT